MYHPKKVVLVELRKKSCTSPEIIYMRNSKKIYMYTTRE